MSELAGTIYGTTNAEGSNTLVIDFENVDITGNLKLNNISINSSIKFSAENLIQLEPNSSNSSDIINSINSIFSSSFFYHSYWWYNFQDTYYNGYNYGSSSDEKFIGGILAPNGKIIFVPYNSSTIGIYDPITNSYSEKDHETNGNYLFSGGVLAPNGKIIFVPLSSSTIGIYDPITNTYNDGYSHNSISYAFWGGVLAPNGKIIFVPHNLNYVGIFFQNDYSFKDINLLLMPYFNKF